MIEIRIYHSKSDFKINQVINKNNLKISIFENRIKSFKKD